jgi:hypothetical protein
MVIQNKTMKTTRKILKTLKLCTSIPRIDTIGATIHATKSKKSLSQNNDTVTKVMTPVVKKRGELRTISDIGGNAINIRYIPTREMSEKLVTIIFKLSFLEPTDTVFILSLLEKK